MLNNTNFPSLLIKINFYEQSEIRGRIKKYAEFKCLFINNFNLISYKYRHSV